MSWQLCSQVIIVFTIDLAIPPFNSSVSCHNSSSRQKLTYETPRLATAESLFLLNKHTTGNLRASISTAKFVIEVERNVDEGLQCRYFILSRDKVIIKEEHESPNSQATTIVPTSISNILVSRSNQSREATVDSSAATSYSATIVTPQKRKKLTVDEMFTPSPDTFTRTRPTFSKNFGDVTVEIIGQVVPETPEEDAYVEVHVKDLFVSTPISSPWQHLSILSLLHRIYVEKMESEANSLATQSRATKIQQLGTSTIASLS